MNFLDFIWGLKGEFIKQKLLQIWISPNDMQGIDFNNMQDLNLLAEKIMPKIIESNPNIKQMIKQNASMFGERQKEVCEVIDMW